MVRMSAEGPVEVLVRVPYVCPERGDAVHLDTLGGEVEGHAEAAQRFCDLG